MMLLSRLPDVLTLSIIMFWCELDELGQLDNAVCNSEDREALLHVFSDKGCVINGTTETLLLNDPLVSWFAARKLKLSCLHLTGMSNAELFDPSSLDVSQIKILSLSDCNFEQMTSIVFTRLVGSCELLETLKLVNMVKYFEQFREQQATASTSFLSQLSRLQISPCPFGFIPCLANHLTNLMELKLDMSSTLVPLYGSIAAGLSQIFINNGESIETIILHGYYMETQCLEALKHCRKMNVFHTEYAASDVTLKTVADVLLVCKDVTHFTIFHMFEYRIWSETTDKTMRVRISPEILLHQHPADFCYFFKHISGFSRLIFDKYSIKHDSILSAFAVTNKDTLTELEVVSSVGSVTAEGLRTLLSTCKQLQTLKLGSCTDITGADLASVLRQYAPQSLQSLIISKHDEITTQSVIDILRNLRQLHHLSCRLCPTVQHNAVLSWRMDNDHIATVYKGL